MLWIALVQTVVSEGAEGPVTGPCYRADGGEEDDLPGETGQAVSKVRISGDRKAVLQSLSMKSAQ